MTGPKRLERNGTSTAMLDSLGIMPNNMQTSCYG